VRSPSEPAAAVAFALPFCRLALLFGGLLFVGATPTAATVLISVAIFSWIASIPVGAAVSRSPRSAGTAVTAGAASRHYPSGALAQRSSRQQ
jgi:hypothetical protein